MPRHVMAPSVKFGLFDGRERLIHRSLNRERFSVACARLKADQGEEDMAKGKDKPSKQTKKPKSDKPKGTGSAYQQQKASGKKG
jgi:hypothetical protein